MDEDHECSEDGCERVVVGYAGSMCARMGRMRYLAVVGYKDVSGAQSFSTVKRTRWGARRWMRRKADELATIRTAVMAAIEEGK